MHDPRIGRFFAVDPLTDKFPMIGSYQFSSNRVIDGLELEGLETYLPYGSKWGYNSGYTVGGMSQNVGVFFGNVGVGVWNGIAGGWNFLGDADKVYFDEGGGVDGLVKSSEFITTGVGEGLEHAKKEVEWFVQDPGDYIEHTTVDDVENILAGVIGAKLSTKVKFSKAKSSIPSKFASLAKTGKINPKLIRFSQNSIKSTFKGGGSVEGLTKGLKNGKFSPDNVSPIRIIEYDGELYSLDNRRLKAFQDAGIDVKYEKVEGGFDSLPQNEKNKFTTTNEGTSIKVRGENN